MTTGTSNPVLPEIRMNLVKPARPVTGRVVSNELCMNGKSASFVKHLTIDVTDTPLAGTFHAGQSFGVITPGKDENGKPHKVRLYSLACPTWGEDGAGNVLSTTPKRLMDEHRPQRPGDDSHDHRLFLGVCSNYLCDLNAGDEVSLSGPNSKRFLLPVEPDDHDYLFLATGTGIAPYRGMLEELLNAPGGPCKSRIHLVMGTPYTSDLLYNDYFQALATQHSNFHYHTAISREPLPDGRPGRYVDSLLEDKLDEFTPLLTNSRTLIYICGLAGMQLGLFKFLARHDMDGDYCERRKPLDGVAPEDWTPEQIKRGIRPTGRCMLEVY